MPRQICFIGDYGAGKSHTIHQLVKPGNPYREQLNVSQGFEHGTRHELCLDFGDFEVIDTRGLNSEVAGFDDGTIIDSVNKITGWPCPPSEDRTVFVWVINGHSRRIRQIRETVRSLVGNRRLVIYVNDRIEIPLDLNWMRYDPSQARQEAIIMLGQYFPQAPITNNPWAIVPLIISQDTRKDMIVELLMIENARRKEAFSKVVEIRASTIGRLRKYFDEVCEARIAFHKAAEADWLQKNISTGILDCLLRLLASFLGLFSREAPDAPSVGIVSVSKRSTTDPTPEEFNPYVDTVMILTNQDAQVPALNCIFTDAELCMIDEGYRVLDSYLELLQKTKPESENRHLFTALPLVDFPSETPLAKIPPATISETYFDGTLRNSLVVALEQSLALSGYYS